ncbi:MAG TPA: hypothetical protein VJA21_32835 [Verrucomicrobiae bacterium]
MRTRLSAARRQQGNLILVALILSGIAGLTLGSYLLLAQNQNVSIYRSQGWNSSMVVAEAGIEDGLQLVNLYIGTFDPKQIYQWTNDAGGAHWDQPSAAVYHVRRTITTGVTPGTQPNTYEVWIFNTNKAAPAVYAEGTVPWTYMHASASQPMFAQAGSSVAPRSPLVRKVLVNTALQPLFVMAMAADRGIDLRGMGVRTDSFDSSDPRYSINHFYPSNNPSMTKDNGDIATNAGFLDAMNIGNAHIRGHVRTGPGPNTININSGSVGDLAWVTNKGNTGKIEAGWSATDFNVAFDPVNVPTTGWLAPDASMMNYTDTNGVKYAYRITKPDRWEISGLTGSLLVDAPTNTTVEIKIGPDDVSLAGSDAIRITPTGARVLLYMTGAHFDLTGGAIIDNQSGIAGNFFLYGSTNCIDITFAGNGNFYGGIYAPQADFTLGGGGKDTYDFVGASVTRSVTMMGHYNFHFDEDLAKTGPSKGFVPVAWNEK